MSAAAPSDKRQLGTPVASGPRTWVQTERAAHEAWGRLTMKSPRAAALMHRLVSMMGHQNAVVVSQKTLAKLVGCSLDTIKRAVRELESERWIDAGSTLFGSTGRAPSPPTSSTPQWRGENAATSSACCPYSTRR